LRTDEAEGEGTEVYSDSQSIQARRELSPIPRK